MLWINIFPAIDESIDFRNSIESHAGSNSTYPQIPQVSQQGEWVDEQTIMVLRTARLLPNNRRKHVEGTPTPEVGEEEEPGARVRKD